MWEAIIETATQLGIMEELVRQTLLGTSVPDESKSAVRIRSSRRAQHVREVILDAKGSCEHMNRIQRLHQLREASNEAWGTLAAKIQTQHE